MSLAALAALLSLGALVLLNASTRAAHERQISRLARDGLSNPEIGAQLFLSPRTVEWHLRKVFAKLGIHSREELTSALPDADALD